MAAKLNEAVKQETSSSSQASSIFEGASANVKAGTDNDHPAVAAEGDGTGATAGTPPNVANGRVARKPKQLDPEEHFPVKQRMPVQVFIEESFGQRLSHWGPTLTAVVSLILAWVVIGLQRQQIALNQKQTDLQTDQVKAQLAEMRFKFLNDLTDKEETKKIPAEIGLAGHGSDALPVVHFALGVEQGQIRDSAVSVVYRMFQAGSYESRWTILQGLMKEFDSPNQLLHVGIVQSLVKIRPLMTPPEVQLAVSKLVERFPPQAACATVQGRTLVKTMATFFPVKDADSITELLKIVRHPRCGDGWEQAIIRLAEAAAAAPAAKRRELEPEVARIESEVLMGLRSTVSDDDLASGGFQEFVVNGQGPVKFDVFQKKVNADFTELKESLNQK